MSQPAAIDPETALAGFRAGILSESGEEFLPRNWSEADWRELFRFTTLQQVPAGDALIRRGDQDPTLFFVLRGSFEVVVHTGDDHSMGPLTRAGAGSVLGEQSFFDGKPRSASVWAACDCEVAAMKPEQYDALAVANPALARELLFALGRILAIRLRRTTAMVAR